MRARLRQRDERRRGPERTLGAPLPPRRRRAADGGREPRRTPRRGPGRLDRRKGGAWSAGLGVRAPVQARRRGRATPSGARGSWRATRAPSTSRSRTASCATVSTPTPWSGCGGACTRPDAGDVVLSAAPGYTFGEVSGGYHKASDHGSLHAERLRRVRAGASRGVPAPRRITDVAPTLLDHFGAGTAGCCAEDRVG